MASGNRADRPLVTGPDFAGIPYRFVALGLVCLGVFTAMSDQTALVLALPTLASEFEVSTSSVLWVVLASQLVITTLSLTLGRFGDLYGRKRFYMAGFALYAAGAAAGSLADGLPELLAARVLQSTGMAMVMANVAALTTTAFPAATRGRALGIMVASMGAGMAAGPLMGGGILAALDWRAIFWVRIPLGIVGALLVWRFLRDTPRADRPQGVDIPGALVLSSMLFSFVLAVNRGASWGWSSVAVLGLFSAAALLLVVFIKVERRSKSPVVALDLFRLPPFSGAVAGAALLSYGMAAVLVLMPFFLVEARGFGTLEAGAIMAGFALAMLLSSPLAGQLSDRFGPRVISTLGLLVFAGGLVFLGTMGVQTSVPGIVLRLAVVGIGRGLFESTNMSVVMGSVKADRIGTASASVNSSRSIGQGIGLAAAGALFAAQTAAYAGARSPLGLDDPAVEPSAVLSGLELALLVAAGMALLGAVTAWFSMAHWHHASAPPEPDVVEAQSSPGGG